MSSPDSSGRSDTPHFDPEHERFFLGALQVSPDFGIYRERILDALGPYSNEINILGINRIEPSYNSHNRVADANAENAEMSGRRTNHGQTRDSGRILYIVLSQLDQIGNVLEQEMVEFRERRKEKLKSLLTGLFNEYKAVFHSLGVMGIESDDTRKAVPAVEDGFLYLDCNRQEAVSDFFRIIKALNVFRRLLQGQEYRKYLNSSGQMRIRINFYLDDNNMLVFTGGTPLTLRMEHETPENDVYSTPEGRKSIAEKVADMDSPFELCEVKDVGSTGEEFSIFKDGHYTDRSILIVTGQPRPITVKTFIKPKKGRWKCLDTVKTLIKHKKRQWKCLDQEHGTFEELRRILREKESAMVREVGAYL